MTKAEAIARIKDHIVVHRYLERNAVKLLEALDMAIKALEESEQTGWIPCSERLPSEDEPFYVLCCDKYGAMMIGNVFECDDGETPYSAENENEYMYDCVAWMPLPEP